MPESNLPLLVGVSKADVGTDYVDLLKFDPDPNETIYVGDIRIDINDTTTKPIMRLSINGVSYLKDFPLLNATTTFSFGRDLKLKNDKTPLLIQIKKTTGTLNATAIITGIRVSLKP